MTMTKEYTCEFCGCVLTEEETYDFNGHITCEDCEDHLFICDCCGEVKDLRDYFVHNEEEDEIICEDCANYYYTICGECGTYVRNSDIYDATDIHGHEVQVCRHCADEYYVTCAHCYRMVHIDSAIYDNYDGEYYCNDCWEDNDVIKDCWNAIKGHGDNAKKLDIVHISTESVFYHQQMIDFTERSGEYLRVLGAPRYPGESFRVCYETDFQQHGLLAFGFNILPEWIDMTIKENPAQRLRTLEIVAETF